MKYIRLFEEFENFDDIETETLPFFEMGVSTYGELVEKYGESLTKGLEGFEDLGASEADLIDMRTKYQTVLSKARSQPTAELEKIAYGLPLWSNGELYVTFHHNLVSGKRQCVAVLAEYNPNDDNLGSGIEGFGYADNGKSKYVYGIFPADKRPGDAIGKVWYSQEFLHRNEPSRLCIYPKAV